MVKLRPGDSEKTEIKTVNYGAFTYVLINAVKEIHAKISGHRDDISQLQGEILELKQKNRALEAWICSQDPAAVVCK